MRRRNNETRGFQYWALFDAKWGFVLIAGGLVISCAVLLKPILGDFNEQAAMLTFGSVVFVAYVITTILRMIGR
jgi:hypothetical protein